MPDTGDLPDLARLLGPEARRSPEMEALWAWLIEQDGGVPNWLNLPPAEARVLQNGLAQRWNAVLPEVATIEPFVVPGSPDVACRRITPPDVRPGGLLFLHGGGWSFGTLDTYARFTRLLARMTRLTVYAADYRLAPEHPFPAPFEDCRAVWRCLADTRRGDGPLVVAGDSAGAHLAMTVMLDAVERQMPRPDAALLFYGIYSADLDSPSYQRFAEGFGLTRAGMSRFWDFYAPDPATRGTPLLSPVLASPATLAGLPPIYMNAAGFDPLLSDSVDMSARLRAAEVDHEFVVHEGVHHGFMQFSLRLHEATRAIERAAAFSARVTGPTS